jgi:hypothetical protein
MRNQIEDTMIDVIQKVSVLSHLFRSEDFRDSEPPLDFYLGVHRMIRDVYSGLIQIRDTLWTKEEWESYR